MGENINKKFKKVIYNKIFMCLLVFAIILISFPLQLFAYPAYQANSDLVIAGPYDTPASPGINWGASAIHPVREFLTVGQKYRIRQNGTINRVYLYTSTKTGLTGFYLKVWRLSSGTTYNLVGTSNNLVNDLQVGSFSTVDLTTTIPNVQEGDYIGYKIEGSENNFLTKTGLSGVDTYYSNSAISGSSFDTSTVEPVATGFAMPINVYMQAPQIVFIGDSIVAGHPGHYSFLESTATTNIESTMEKQFSNLTGYSYQNMGVGSQTTTNIAARFTTDVINLHPKVVIIEGGINDISFGGANKSTFISNWTTMLSAAQADPDITTIIVLKILPWTNGSTVQMQTHDDWNSSLVTLASNYSKAIVVDANSSVGEFRVGGDAGNIWNIQSQYSSDGTHFNQAGHLKIAQALADSLDVAVPTTTDNTDVSWHNTDVTITLTCNDGSGSGCAHTYYTTDGTDPTTSSTEGTSITLSTDGTYTIKYFSVDSVGNTEIVKAASNTVKIDTTAPLTPIATPSTGTYNTTQNITLTADGSDSIRYSIIETPATCSAGTLYTTPIEVSTTQTIYVRACDSLNNFSTASFAYVISRPTSSGSTLAYRNNFLAQQQTLTSPIQLPTITPTIIPTPSTPIIINRILRLSIPRMWGDDIKALQTLLNTKGYDSGIPDGNFGPKTKTAVIAFQKANGLVPDGSVGSNTLKYLNGNQTTTTTSPTIMQPNVTRILKLSVPRMIGDDVLALQTYLSEKGYDVGTLDGVLGNKTKSAIIAFQTANGLIPDGLVGAKTREMMK